MRLHSLNIVVKSAVGAIAAVVLGGCTWVPLTDAGAGVNQATADQVAHCRHVGAVSSSTQDKIGVQRSRGKVAEELVVLARNEAASIGGDTIVPAGAPVEGRQDFTVYRCGP
jgi:hypothetical protein